MRYLAWLVFVACAEPTVHGFAIETIDPSSAPSSKTVPVQIGGMFHLPISNDLDRGSTVVDQPTVTIGAAPLESSTWQSEALIEGSVPAGLPVGRYDVTVRLGDRTDLLAMGYEVLDDTPPPRAAPFAISGEHWLLPCISNGTPNPRACSCASGVLSHSRTVGGNPGERWHVTIRIRGVMEHMSFVGGTAGPGNWYVGGTLSGGGNNYYKLTVSAPPSHYFINSGDVTQSNSWPTDYEATFDVEAGATLTFDASGQDSIQWEGVDAADQPISIAGIVDPPQPYNGQFAQLDVIAAVPF